MTIVSPPLFSGFDNDNLRVHLDEAEASIQRSQAANDIEVVELKADAAAIKALTDRLDKFEAAHR